MQRNLSNVKEKKGFTLIELLIVVAIIAILAAIAVPNFLEAQTRAKVSRVKNDMRTIATALETYFIDNNNYPAAMEQFSPLNMRWDAYREPPFHSRVPSKLTTPIAYMTSIPDDPFRTTRGAVIQLGPFLENFRTRQVYFNFDYLRAVFPNLFLPTSNNNFTNAQRLAGRWLIYSVGPDGDETNGTGVNGRANYRDYDPTNGTVSAGNIFRTQRNGDRLGADPFFF